MEVYGVTTLKIRAVMLISFRIYLRSFCLLLDPDLKPVPWQIQNQRWTLKKSVNIYEHLKMGPVFHWALIFVPYCKDELGYIIISQYPYMYVTSTCCSSLKQPIFYINFIKMYLAKKGKNYNSQKTYVGFSRYNIQPVTGISYMDHDPPTTTPILMIYFVFQMPEGNTHSILEGQYDLHDTIGTGGFAKVQQT